MGVKLTFFKISDIIPTERMLIMKKEITKTLPDIDKENFFMSFCRTFIGIIVLVFMAVLTFSSLFFTTGMEIVKAEDVQDSAIYRMKESLEWVVYYSDGFVGNLIWLAICIAACFLVLPLMKRLTLGQELVLIVTWTLYLGIFWVYSSMTAPSEDSYMVTGASFEFAKNNFDLLSDRYFSNYSYQLGYVFFNEILIRIANTLGEPKNMIYLEIVNVIMLAAAYVGIILINKRIFKDRRVCDLTALLLAFAAQPIIFSVFLYGIIPGITFAVYAVLFMAIYLQTDKFRYAVPSAIFMALAVMTKSNNNIVLVSLVILTLGAMFKRKKFVKDIAYLALTLALSLSISPAICNMYENRSGIELGDSVPYVSWFALGLNEAGNAPGWYNGGYTVGAMERSDFNAKEASRESMGEIKNRINYFSENPQYRHDFFYKKFVSQWNETSYQSIWNNIVRYKYDEPGRLATWVCGSGQKSVKRYMDVYAQLIFAAVFVGIISCLRNKNFLSVTFPLIILGGMMYHLLAESKSQYAMPYFILMIGFAAYGLTVIYDLARAKTKGSRLIGRIFTALEPKKSAEKTTEIKEAESGE